MTRILVIDDEPAIRDNLVEVLRLDGFDTAAAENGVAGIEMARQYHPDLILCDIMMPELDGYAVLEELRADPSTESIPFIFVSAKAERTSIRAGMALGADDYLTKPFTPRELIDAVHSRLRRRESISQDTARVYEQVKQQLMRLVTHELRTPLATINQVLEIVTRQINQVDPHELQDLINSMSAGSRRLARTVDQFVFNTQLDMGILNPETVRATHLSRPLWELLIAANDQARRFTPDRADVNIRLNARDQQALVVCEPGALRHALAEIVSNALRFSPRNGQVEVAQWRSGDAIWLSVLDRGPGMSPEQIEVALADFGQIDRETREHQGMGMGLPLARRIVEAHGGSLEIKAAVGRGTQVVIGLPLATEEEEDEAG